MPSETPAYPLRAIYFNLTNRCNLQCRHCWLAPPLATVKHKGSSRPAFTEGLGLEAAAAAVDQAMPLGLTSVKLTGGEPFLRTDIFAFIDLFHRRGLAIDIETNATLIDKTAAERLSGYPIRSISTSIDSTDAKWHDGFRGAKGAWAKTTEGIGHLVAQGLRPQIIMALGRANKDQIEAVTRLAVRLGAGSLKINPITPISGGAKMHQQEETLAVDDLLTLARWVAGGLQPHSAIPVIFSLPIVFAPLKQLIADASPWCAIHNILGIVENGDISFCGIQCVEKKLVMGNINTHAIAELWRDNALLNRMRELVPKCLEGICARCFFKKRCLGYCRACAYHQDEKLTGPYWLCQQAFDMGLFPEARCLY